MSENLNEYTITLIGSIDENFLSNLQQLITNVSPETDMLTLNISSSGGIVTYGIALYNYLKQLPYTLRCHNLGEVSSAAILPYLAGEIRTASPFSKFMIHPIEAHVEGDLPLFKIQELYLNLVSDIQRYVDIVSQELPEFARQEDIQAMLEHQSFVISSEKARAIGLVNLYPDT